jgi:hypothetical protein
MATLIDRAGAPETFPVWSIGRMYAIAFDLDTTFKLVEGARAIADCTVLTVYEGRVGEQ